MDPKGCMIKFYVYSPSLSTAVGPPLLLPVYFHAEVVYYTLKKRKWKVYSFTKLTKLSYIAINFAFRFLLRILRVCYSFTMASTWCMLLYWVVSGRAFAGTSSSDSWRATGLSGALRPTIFPWILTWTSVRTGCPCSWPVHVMWRSRSSMIGSPVTWTTKLSTSKLICILIKFPFLSHSLSFTWLCYLSP